MKSLNNLLLIRIRVLCLVLLLPMQCVLAQKLQIFQDTTADGIPAKIGNEWTALGKKSGVTLHLRYTELPAIQEPKMYLFIDRKMPLGEFVEFDTYKLEVIEAASYIERIHHFKEVGEYAVSFTDADKNVIVTDTIRLRYDQKVVFCQDVKRGVPIGEMTEVLPSPTGLYYYTILLSGSRSLDTHQMIMHIYQHDGTGFNTHIGKYERYVEHSRNYASFRGLFLDEGHYKVRVFKFNGEPYAEAVLYLKPPKS